MTEQEYQEKINKLFAEFESCEADIALFQAEKHHIESDIDKTMADHGATLAKSPFCNVTATRSLEPTIQYNRELSGPLAVIAEHLSPDEFNDTLNNPKPKRQFLIPEIKKLAKNGGVFRTALDAATFTLPQRAKVKSGS